MSSPAHRPAIDDLLDRALQAINEGDRVTAAALAGQVLAADHGNLDAEDLLAAPSGGGEMRRLTIMFADLVDSTALSTQIEPEIYRTVVGRYREQVIQIISRYEGHLCSTKGDGLLAVFGHPKAHENDVQRAAHAGLDITRDVAKLSEQVQRRFGFEIAVRVGIHRGIVYLDKAQDDVYGLGANMTARVSGLAQPGTVAVSSVLEPLLRDHFELQAQQAQSVKGIAEPVEHYIVVAERLTAARVHDGPLIGREDEVDYVRTSWEEAAAGTLTTPGIAFTGEAGIGKSRLASAAVELAEQSGGVVLALYGSPFHATAGLHPVRTLLERRCGIGRLTAPGDRLQLLEAELRQLALEPDTMVPLLAPVLGIAEQHGYQRLPASGTRLYDQIAEGVQKYLLACLDDRPGVLLVEDVHWYDPSTLDVVEALLGSRTKELLIVITGRPGAKLPASGETKLFELEPLSAQQAEELIAALDPALTPDDRRDVRRRCDGVPLYIEEVVNGIGAAPAAGLAAERVPDALYEPLFAALRTSENAVTVAEAASAIGREIDHGLLRAVVDIDSDDLDHVIGELEEAMVLERIGEHGWRFRHELLREVAYELAPPSTRRSLHGRVGDALVDASDAAPDWREVALHYTEAERFSEAATASQQAAADARRRGALAEARNYLDMALEQLSRMPESSARNQHEVNIRLYRGFFSAAATGHTSMEAAADFERCLELIGSDVSVPLYATLMALWSYYTARGDLKRATKLADSLRNRPGDNRASTGLTSEATIGMLFGMLSWFHGEFTDARNTLEEAAETALSTDAPEIESRSFAPNDPIASTHTYVALARFLHGDLIGAEAALDDTDIRCAALGFPHGPFSQCYGRSLETWIRIEAGQLDRAGALATELAGLGKKFGFDEWVMVAATQQATVAALTAIEQGAESATLKGHIATMTAFVQGWRAAELRVFLMCYDAVLARVLAAVGKHDAALERADIALELAEETGMHFYDAELLRVRALTCDAPEARRAGLMEAIELARRQDAVIFELRAAADYFTQFGDNEALTSVADRMPAGQSWPELARARALLA